MEIHRQDCSLVRESQKATDAMENVDEMTQLDCAILHAVHSVLVYMGQPKWDTRQNLAWDMGQGTCMALKTMGH